MNHNALRFKTQQVLKKEKHEVHKGGEIKQANEREHCNPFTPPAWQKVGGCQREKKQQQINQM